MKILHFADAHFGIENYGRFDSQTGLHTRLMDFRDSLNAGIDLALQWGVEAAVFAGDAYKSRDPSQTQQREFARCLSRLVSEGVPVVLLAGNHDIPNAKGRANSIEIFGELAGERVHVIDQPKVIVIAARNGQNLQIAGMPYLIRSHLLSQRIMQSKGVAETTEAISELYAAGIDQLAQQCVPDLPTILMGHFSVSHAILSARQSTFLANEPQVSLSVLARRPFDYVALGHIHKFQDLNRGQQPPVVYCGSLDRVDFGESDEPKGVCLAEVECGFARVEHVELLSRPFIDIELDATGKGEDPMPYLLSVLSETPLEKAVVKLTYRISSDQEKFLRPLEIRAALGRSFFVASMRKEITDQLRVSRSRALSESLNPLRALEAYLETQDQLRSRRDELLAAAEPLILELEREEGMESIAE